MVTWDGGYYSCKYCGFQSMATSDLKKHMRLEIRMKKTEIKKLQKELKKMEKELKSL